MSKNKKLIILITILISIMLCIIGVFIYTNEKVDNNVIGENNKNQTLENIKQENITINEQTNSIENEVNNIEFEEQPKNIEEQIEETKKEEIKTIEKNKETTINNNTRTENNKTNNMQSTNEEININTDVYTDESKNVDTNTNTDTQNIEENNYSIQECNHIGNWYNTKEEAITIYKAEVKKWDDMWLNDEIDNETYYQNRPHGYEIYDCPICNRWTINIYYK